MTENNGQVKGGGGDKNEIKKTNQAVSNSEKYHQAVSYPQYAVQGSIRK
jgi:hypothetical protein